MHAHNVLQLNDKGSGRFKFVEVERDEEHVDEEGTWCSGPVESRSTCEIACVYRLCCPPTTTRK